MATEHNTKDNKEVQVFEGQRGTGYTFETNDKNGVFGTYEVASGVNAEEGLPSVGIKADGTGPYKLGDILHVTNEANGKSGMFVATDKGGMPNGDLDFFADSEGEKSGNGPETLGLEVRKVSGTNRLEVNNGSSFTVAKVGEVKNSAGRNYQEAIAHKDQILADYYEIPKSDWRARATKWDEAEVAIAENAEIKTNMKNTLADAASFNENLEERESYIGGMGDHLYAGAEQRILSPQGEPSVENETQMLAQGGEVGNKYVEGSENAPTDVASIPTQPVVQPDGGPDPIMAMVNPQRAETPVEQGLAGINPKVDENYINEARAETVALASAKSATDAVNPEKTNETPTQGINPAIDESYVKEGLEEAQTETLAAATQAEPEIEPVPVLAAATPQNPELSAEEKVAQDFDSKVSSMSPEEAKEFRSDVGNYATNNKTAPSQLFDKGTVWDDVRYADAVKEGVSERIAAEGVNTDVNNIATNDAEPQNDSIELDGATKESAQLAMGNIGNLSSHIDDGTTVSEPQTGADLADQSRTV